VDAQHVDHDLGELVSQPAQREIGSVDTNSIQGKLELSGSNSKTKDTAALKRNGPELDTPNSISKRALPQCICMMASKDKSSLTLLGRTNSPMSAGMLEEDYFVFTGVSPDCLEKVPPLFRDPLKKSDLFKGEEQKGYLLSKGLAIYFNRLRLR
jgi:hypothetical protein